MAVRQDAPILPQRFTDIFPSVAALASSLTWNRVFFEEMLPPLSVDSRESLLVILYI